jgi:hypothetical protein
VRHSLDDEERDDLVDRGTSVELLGVGVEIREDGETHRRDEDADERAAGKVHGGHLADLIVLGGEHTLNHGLVTRLPDGLLQEDPE